MSYHGSIHEPDNKNNYWWYYYYLNDKTYVSHTPQGAGGTPESVGNALTNPGGANLPLSSTVCGGTIVVSYGISGNYQTPTTTSSSIGNLTMTLSVKPTTTLDDIKDLLSDIQTVDIYASGFGTAHAGNQHINYIPKEKPIYEAEINLHIQTSDVAYDHIAINYRSLRLENLGLADTNTLTGEAAQKAISASAKALAIVSEQRSLFGAYQNRLESAHSTADGTHENVQDAESRLRDTDMSKELLQYSTADILTRAGEALMAQSNSRLSQVLSLLQPTE